MISDKRLVQVSVMLTILSLLLLAPIFVEAACAEPLKIPQGLFIAANVADLHSTHQAVRSGRGIEANAIMGDGTGARAIALKSASTVGVLFLTERLAKRRPRLARVTLYTLTGVIAGVSARNYRISRGG